ncbi:MAG: pyridoxamine 5'-phosphate oxidase family protein [bacterium]
MNNLEVLKQGKELIEKADAVFLTTIDVNGYPSTRAMLNLRNKKQFPGLISFFEKVKDTEIYFTTNTSSTKIKEILFDQNVSAYFCDANSWLGMMYQGKIEIVKDKNIKNAIWQDNWDMYYPGGKDSDDYAILKLEPKLIKSYYQFKQTSIKL